MGPRGPAPGRCEPYKYPAGGGIHVLGIDASPVGTFHGILRLIIPTEAFNHMVGAAARRYPLEACGIMMGRVSGAVGRVEYVRELRNIVGRPGSFWFSEREWMEEILRGNELGYEYIGLFHSHDRDVALPSLSDRQRMLECPGEVWLILAYRPGRPPSATAWRVDDWGSSIIRVEVEVV